MAREIKTDVVIGMHWGTIELSDEPHWKPPVRFMRSAQKNGLALGQALVMKIGETRILP